jgi:uncharacterized protein with FMN-binding domain
MLSTYEQNSKAKITSIVVSIFVIAGFVIFADHIKAEGGFDRTDSISSKHSSNVTINSSTGSSAGSTSNSNSSSASSGSTSSTSGSSGFTDGTFTASSDYYVPHGYESIQVSLTLKGGVIENVSIQNSESDPTSAAFQENFAAAFRSQVVGKKLSGLQISVIAGASDTTQGFADAVSQIASKARA